MPSNDRSKETKELINQGHKIGMLNTPLSWKDPNDIPWAYDNGCFKKFDEKLYFKYLDSSYQRRLGHPLFVCVPDVVGCHYRTLALWRVYYPILYKYGYPLAFVAQDGCEPYLVPKEADWIFIGGLDPWKMQNIHKFIGNKPVHVGRINSYSKLHYCKSLGVASVDGTAFLRGRGKHFRDFIKWFNGDPQIKLWEDTTNGIGKKINDQK